MTSDPPDLGKGLFGYRKSAVNQILADRDIMLRQAEGRVRAAEGKVAELQNELQTMRERSSRTDEQVERLRAQLEALMAGTPLPHPTESRASAVPPPAPAPVTRFPEPSPAPMEEWNAEPAPWDGHFSEPAEAPAPYEESAEGGAFDEYGASASFHGLDDVTPSSESQPYADLPGSVESSADAGAGDPDAIHLFANQDAFAPQDEGRSLDLTYTEYPPEGDRDLPAWVDATPPPAEPTRKVEEMPYQPADEDAQSSSSPPSDDEAFSSVPYGFSLQPHTPEESGTNPEATDQPVFRAFTEESFDHPQPSEYLGNAGPEPAPMSTAPQAPEWEGEPNEPWAPQPFQPSVPPPIEWSAPAQPAEWDAGAAPSTDPAAPSTDWDIPAPAEAPAAPAWPSSSTQEWAKEAAAPPPAAFSEPPPPAEQPPGSVSPQSSDLTNRFLAEELKGILAAAEESAGRILERARVTSEQQIAQSNRLWREVQAELARFSSWREQVEPVIRAVHAKVEGVRSQIEEVPEKIRQALAPMADSISMIDSDLAELASASVPPLLLTPSGLDPGSPVHDWPIGGTALGNAERPEARQEPSGEGTEHLAG